MNRLLVVLVAAIGPVLAGARDIPATTLELGGSTALSFSSLTTTASGLPDTRTRTLALDTWGSYYVAQNLGLGLSLKLSEDTLKSGPTATTSRTIMIGPAVAYSHSVSARSSVFGLAGLGYARYASGGAASDGWGFSLTGGVSYFPVDAFAIAASIGYQATTLKDGADTSFTTSGLVAGVGVSVFFLPAAKT